MRVSFPEALYTYHSEVPEQAPYFQIYQTHTSVSLSLQLRLIEGRNTGFPNAIKALNENGSELFTFDMDDNRTYLSVTIPVHSYFAPKDKRGDKKAVYEKRIVKILKDEPLTMTELALAMGYKGITAKLTKTVDDMIVRGVIEKIAGEGRTNRIKVR